MPKSYGNNTDLSIDLPETVTSSQPYSSAKKNKLRTLLLVDDEPNILAGLTTMLRNSGYHIVTAGSAKAALECLTKNSVDVMVSDHVMPEMTGVELFRQVKKHYPDTVRIMLSGYADLQSVTEAINEGAIYKFLIKPCDSAHLQASVEDAFRYGELKRENEQLTRELEMINIELARVNKELMKALQEKSVEAIHEEESLAVAQEILQRIPLPIIAANSKGTIIAANEASQIVCPQGFPLLGRSVKQSLPTKVVACFAEQTDQIYRAIEIEGSYYDIVRRSMKMASPARATLLILMPRHDVV